MVDRDARPNAGHHVSGTPAYCGLTQPIWHGRPAPV